MRLQLENLNTHMNTKVNYTISGDSTQYNYGPSDGKFGKKVNDARKKVDPSVGNTSELVTIATLLKTALSSNTGAIKLVVDFWETIDKIDSEDPPNKGKDDLSNKPAKDAIDEIKRYTDDTLPAHTSIGQHTTFETSAQAKNWNIEDRVYVISSK